MPKRKPFDIMAYWPIAIFVLGLTGSWFTLKSEASQQEKRIEKVETKVEEQEKESSEILVNQATQQAVLNNIYEAVKELKSKK